MKPELKKKLLERMFSSKEYYLRMMDYYATAVEGAEEALAWFEEHRPTDDENVLRTADAWRTRALPNMKGYLRGKDEDIEHYERGEFGCMTGTAHNIMTLDRNLDHVGDKWWDYVPEEYLAKYFDNMYFARKMASNIAWTLGEAWKDDEILRERITGPIDEDELLRYLEPEDVA